MRHAFKPGLLGGPAKVLGRSPCSRQPLSSLQRTCFTASPLLPRRPAAWQRGFASGRPCQRPDTQKDGPLFPPKKSRSGRRTVLLLAALLAAGAAYFATAGSPDADADDDGSSRRRGAAAGLNQDTFVPFAVAAREDVSPSAFVLTLRLPPGTPAAARAATRDAVAAAWRHGLWSVEVRQPQLQIARDYTPLPAMTEAGRLDEDGDLRLFVRAVPGGEVSKYLSQRAVGSTVDLRGPRLSFDAAARLGGRSQVVVLAGGTGVASALQSAAAVLGGSGVEGKPAVSIFWANRLPHDSAGVDDKDDKNAGQANPIVRDLRALQRRYGADRVRVHSFVDAHQTFITEGAMRDAVAGRDGMSSGWWWPWARKQNESTVTAASASPPSNPSCLYHSARVLTTLEADPKAGSAEAKTCSCTRDSNDGDASSYPGKNLVLVSGPDGFIAAWAGAKTWTAGKERQGPVGGILGSMAARDPQTLGDWLVLKL